MFFPPLLSTFYSLPTNPEGSPHLKSEISNLKSQIPSPLSPKLGKYAEEHCFPHKTLTITTKFPPIGEFWETSPNRPPPGDR
jgi:hypothetical protein